MTETGVFVAGSVVTVVVFTGVFLYAMLSFGHWEDRTKGKTTPPKKP
jgi:hypothetical protein